jgi:hypothetical protein
MLLFEAASKLFNCVAVDLLNAAVIPAPVGVERLMTILLRRIRLAEVAVALDVWKIPEVENAAPVEVAFR